MEIRFHESGDAPRPPAETRIRALSVEPWPDGRRVGVEVQITPFQQRPNLHVNIYDAQGREVASLGAMQILQTQMGFTLHLRQPDTRGQYTVAAYLAYPDPEPSLGTVHQVEASFEIVE